MKCFVLTAGTLELTAVWMDGEEVMGDGCLRIVCVCVFEMCVSLFFVCDLDRDWWWSQV